MRISRPTAKAFTLPELMIGLAVTLLVGGIIYLLFNAGMMLYTQNVSLGQTHSGGLEATERLFLDIAQADEVPVLTDDTGATLGDNGPAAGIRFYNLGSSRTYGIPSAVGATVSSMTVTRTTVQPAPQIGDKISMADLGFQGMITAISSSGTSHTISFASAIGNGFNPVKTTGTVIPAGSKCFLLQPSSFVAVNGVLRHYPRALSVAQDGAPAYNNPANFIVVSALLPLTNQVNAFPFQYLDITRRSIDVTLRLRAPAYGSRVGAFYAFQNLKTTVAYRSAVTQ